MFFGSDAASQAFGVAPALDFGSRPSHDQDSVSQSSSAATPTVQYLDSNAAVSRFLESIGSTRELAIDTEGASFHRFIDRIYLVQLSTRTHHGIIDPLPIAAPDALGALLADPKVEVVFHDADYDLRLLHQDYGWRPTNLFDTRIAAQLLGIQAFGLAALLERAYGRAEGSAQGRARQEGAHRVGEGRVPAARRDALGA
ncbi:MAG: hypothetical protein EBS65_22850 [Betaproteobacteria bacterium]|nr:hypothetical protein [Betaproteobacteria bacterium]